MGLWLSACSEPTHAPLNVSPPPPAAVVPALTAVALPARTPVPGARFEALDPAKLGIDFVHRWAPPPAQALQFTGPFAGGGVALGDYDGDGRLDVFLTRPADGGRLYRNTGGLTFADVTEQVGIGDDGWTTGASFVDLDADGDLDLFVGRYNAANRVYVNDGGRFTERAAAMGLAYAGATVSMAWADYDRDGDLDGYLVTYRRTPPEDMKGNATLVNGRPLPPEVDREYVQFIETPNGPLPTHAGQRDVLYRNNGDGTFSDVTTDAGIRAAGDPFAGWEMGLSARFWDYDGDGWQDLYVANDFFGADHLYHNEQGRFRDVSRQALPHTPWFSMGADAADINNDGRMDLFAADMSGTNHLKQKLSMGDMNDDGWFLEAVVPPQYMRNAVYLNTGTPRFMEAAWLTGLANTDWTWTPRFGDLDEDGWVDLFVSNGMTRDFSNSDVRQQLKGKGEWNGVLNLDFWKQQPPRKDPNLAFRNTGALGFESVGPAWGLGAESVSFGAALGDLDGDGDLDVVTNDFEAAPRIYRNRSAKHHRVVVQLVGAQVGTRVVLETEAGTQVRAVAASGGFMSTNAPTLHFGLGALTVIKQMTVHWATGQRQAFTNLTADQRYTVRMPKPAAPSVAKAAQPLFRYSGVLARVRHQEDGFDDFSLQPLLPHRVSSLGPALAWGRFAGQPVVFQGGAAGHAGVLLRMDGQPVAVPALLADAHHEDLGAVWFDADGDGDQDLYVVSGGAQARPGAAVYQDRLYVNEGLTLRRAPLPDLRDSGGPVAAADFDGDGDVDLFVGGRLVPGAFPTTPKSRLLENQGGQFVDVTETRAAGLGAAGMVTGALWSDADGDGRLDLLLTTEWGTVQLWKNSGKGLFDATMAVGLHHWSGWFNSIVGADFDGDGDIDYAVGNTGLNSKYQPTREHPTLIYYGAFGGGGQRIIEASYEDETLYPVRGRSCSSSAMPELRAQYDSFNDFAKSTAAEIYGDALNKAQRFSANTLESGVFINQGGRFEFRPLPRLAQVAPVYGMAVFDENGDGRLDLLLAQNFFGPERETGRMDGGTGLLLRGDGKGGFVAVVGEESGLIMPDDATAATLVDVNQDGRPDVAVATHAGPIRTWLQVGHGAKPFAVRFEDGVSAGAQVVATLADGSTRLAELYAGEGYLGQSPATVWLATGGQAVSSVAVRWPGGVVQVFPVGEETSLGVRRPAR